MLKPMLRSFPLFERIPEEELEKLVMAMIPSSPEKGKVIYKQGGYDCGCDWVAHPAWKPGSLKGSGVRDKPGLIVVDMRTRAYRTTGRLHDVCRGLGSSEPPTNQTQQGVRNRALQSLSTSLPRLRSSGPLHGADMDTEHVQVMPVRRGQYFGAHQCLYAVPREHTAEVRHECDSTPCPACDALKLHAWHGTDPVACGHGRVSAPAVGCNRGCQVVDPGS